MPNPSIRWRRKNLWNEIRTLRVVSNEDLLVTNNDGYLDKELKLFLRLNNDCIWRFKVK